MGVLGLIFGIISLITCWFGWVPSYGLSFSLTPVILGILGIIFSVAGRSSAAKNNTPAGVAIAGLVLSIIGMILGGIGVSICVVCSGILNPDSVNSFGSYFQN